MPKKVKAGAQTTVVTKLIHTSSLTCLGADPAPAGQ